METTSKTKKESQKSTDSGVLGRITDLFEPNPESEYNKTVKMGIKAVLSNTVLRRLPTPLNMVVPMAVEKVILEYGIPEGREILLKGLRWIKKATDEKPVNLA